jgi:PEP-CTERM motif
MKLKHIALAVAMVAAGAAQAAPIDNGAGGNGGLFFTIWDAGSSYTRNLNININTFESTVAGASVLDLNWAADQTLTDWLATANTSTLKWNVVAADRQGANRLLQTYQVLPAFPKGDDVMRNVTAATSAFATAVNSKLAAADSATYAVGTTGYAGVSTFGDNPNNFLGFSNAGSFAMNSYANGMKFERIDAKATGIAKSIYTQYADAGNDVRVYLDDNKTLHISAVMPAVPEPETYAMLLAGLGIIGTVVRRRVSISA